MIQLSFVDYLLARSDGLLLESERAIQQMRWNDADDAIQEWVRLVPIIDEWQDALYGW